MIKLKAIKADPFDVRAYRRAVGQALDKTARQVKAQFEQTTATWQHKPSFDIDTTGEFERVIGTDDENYQRLDEGTRPHVIVARGKALAFPSGHQAKTRPRVIGSGSGGSSGDTVFTKRVQHPGTAPREFTDVIGEQAEQTLADEVQQAIDGAV